MANMTSRRFLARAVAVLTTFTLAALACGAPLYNNSGDTQTQPGGPYWACATATPVPTIQVTELWYSGNITPTEEVRWLDTTPVPTETPYYRYGEFYLGQGAVVNDLLVTLVRVEEAGGNSVATFSLGNQSGTEMAFTLSQYVFAVDVAGNHQSYDSAGTDALGLPNPGEVELEPLAPGEVREESLAFAGRVPAQFGFTVNNLSAAPPPVWFSPGTDPVDCPHGQASWPIPMRGGQIAQMPGSSVLGLTPLGDVHYRLTSPDGCSDWGSGSSGHCDVWVDTNGDGDADTHMTLLHHGLDLAAPEGTPIYAPMQGIVTFSGWSEVGYGNLLVVRAPVGGGNYVWMYYGHQHQPPFPAVGDTVHCGENVGVLGTTGNSTGPHLHWETRLGALERGPYGARDIDPNGQQSQWDFVCASEYGNPPYLDECKTEGGC